jgi:DNA polymerase-3 subunit alpha
MVAQRVNKNTRNGEQMAFFTLADRFSEMEVVVFPKVLARCGADIKAEQVVCAEGDLSIREGEEPKLLLQTLTLLKTDEDFAPASSAGGGEHAPQGKLYLKLPSLSAPVCVQALDMIRAAGAGRFQVIVFDNSQKKYVSAKGVTSAAEEPLLSRLCALLGKENVIKQAP